MCTAGRRSVEPQPVHASLDADQGTGSCPRYATCSRMSCRPSSRHLQARRDSAIGRNVRLKLVFFGKLEERKGVGLFCDALDLLSDTNLPTLSVTFLGTTATVPGRDALSYVGGRANHWPFTHRLLTDRDRRAAVPIQNLNPDVLMMEPAEDWYRCDAAELLRPPKTRGFRWSVVLTFGTVLLEGEEPDSARALAAAGHGLRWPSMLLSIGVSSTGSPMVRHGRQSMPVCPNAFATSRSTTNT
jgi:hypothetical protein